MERLLSVKEYEIITCNEDYIEAIRLVSEKKVVLSPLISKHFAFQDYPEAYRYIDENRESTMKVIINVQE